MNRKANGFIIASKTLYFGISIFILAALALGLVILILSHRSAITVTPPELESFLLASRFVNSPQCFAYQDPFTTRVYPGLINMDRFKSEIIKDCYISATTKDFQFQLKLKNLDTKKEEIIHTEEWFNIPSFTIIESVQIKQDGKISNGQLLIFVQKPI